MTQEEKKGEEQEEETVTIKKSEFEQYEEKINDAENLAKRMKADLENYRRSVERDRESLKTYICSGVIEKFLPVLDSFDQAMVRARSEDERKGIGLIYSQLKDILTKEGLKAIDAVDMPFDSSLHEIMMTEESDKEDDIILEEFQKGYMLKDRVIRHSKVKVSKKKEDQDAQ